MFNQHNIFIRLLVKSYWYLSKLQILLYVLFYFNLQVIHVLCWCNL